MMTRTEVKKAVVSMLEDLQESVEQGTEDNCIFLRNLRTHFFKKTKKEKLALFEADLEGALDDYFRNRGEDWNFEGVIERIYNEVSEDAIAEFEEKDYQIVTEVLDEWVADEIEKYRKNSLT